MEKSIYSQIKNGTNSLRDFVQDQKNKELLLEVEIAGLKKKNDKKSENLEIESQILSEFKEISTKLNSFDKVVATFALYENNFVVHRDKLLNKLLSADSQITELRMLNKTISQEKRELEQSLNKHKAALEGLEKMYNNNLLAFSEKFKDLIEKSLMVANFNEMNELEHKLTEERIKRIQAEQRLNAKQNELQLTKLDYDALLRVNQDMNQLEKKREENKKQTMMITEGITKLDDDFSIKENNGYYESNHRDMQKLSRKKNMEEQNNIEMCFNSIYYDLETRMK